jgi:DNA polymerase-3 subunit delta'
MPEVMMLAHEWPLDEKDQKDLDEKKRKPSQEIKVEGARSLVSFSQISRSGGVGKVAWIHPADRMNVVTANTLLKTLEEPPEGLRFVLTSGAAHELLPTIRSRCQHYAMQWPSKEESMAWLIQEGIKTEEDAQVWLQASAGRAEDAMALAHSFKHNAKAWIELPRSVFKGDVGALSDLSGPQAVSVMQKICHDMMCVSLGAQPKFFPAQSLSAKTQLAAMTEWSKALILSAQTADHPFNLGLMHEALVAQARGFLNELA